MAQKHCDISKLHFSLDFSALQAAIFLVFIIISIIGLSYVTTLLPRLLQFFIPKVLLLLKSRYTHCKYRSSAVLCFYYELENLVGFFLNSCNTDLSRDSRTCASTPTTKIVKKWSKIGMKWGKIGNPGTRVLDLKYLTYLDVKNPGLNPVRVPGCNH